jgi:hypothetical protein
MDQKFVAVCDHQQLPQSAATLPFMEAGPTLRKEIRAKEL